MSQRMKLIQHGATLFGLAVALCVAGASALSAYFLLRKQPYFVAHEGLAQGAYVLAGSLGFWLGIRHGRVVTLLFLASVAVWSIVAAGQLYAH